MTRLNSSVVTVAIGSLGLLIDEPKSDRSRRPGSTGILLVGWVEVANVCNAGS
jgi:hypothetical protein